MRQCFFEFEHGSYILFCYLQKEKEVESLKQQLQKCQEREAHLQQEYNAVGQEAQLKLSSELAAAIDSSSEHSADLKQLISAVNHTLQSLGEKVSGLATSMDKFEPGLCNLKGAVASLLELEKRQAVQSGLAESASKSQPPPRSASTAAEDWMKPTSRSSTGTKSSDLNAATSNISGSGNHSKEKRETAPDLLVEQSPWETKQTPSTTSQPLRKDGVQSNVRSTRVLVPLLNPASRTPASASRGDIFTMTLCSSTSSESEDDAIVTPKVVRTRTPLQFATNSKSSYASYGRQGKPSPASKVPSVQHSACVTAQVSASTKPLTSPRRRASSYIHSGKRSSGDHSIAKPSIAEDNATADKFDWTPDPAAELFDSLFKTGGNRGNKRKSTAVPVSQPITFGYCMMVSVLHCK